MIATEEIRSDFQAAMQQRDYHFVIVRSLDEALDALQEYSGFDIAMLQEDFDMPDSGWAVARALRRRFGSEVRIVMLIHSRYNDDYYLNQIRKTTDWAIFCSRSIHVAHLLHEFDYSKTAA
ncbi:MAG TPA: response regulator [Anaerolineae bacterium]|nr:response regulator [Anaerolineae bacterium]